MPNSPVSNEGGRWLDDMSLTVSDESDPGHKTEWQLAVPVTSERSSEPPGNRNGSPPDRESRAPRLESPEHDAPRCPTGHCCVAGRTCAECRAAPSATSPACCAWAKDYYQQQRAKGKPGNTVVRALAYKWIRILFRCWKDRTPYCESKYLQGLERRQRFTRQDSPVKLQWKTSAGFRKIDAATS